MTRPSLLAVATAAILAGCAMAGGTGADTLSTSADLFATIEQRLQASRPLALFVAPLLMVAVAILPVPVELPAMLNGMVFGPVLGTAVTWGGALSGAWISYELARAFGRPLVERFVAERHLRRADRITRAAGAPALLLLRLTPLVAFTAVNWISGLTGLRRSTFLWTTAVGIIPGAIAFTTLGTGLSALYTHHPRLSIAFALALVALIVILARRSRADAVSREA